ncbi:NAD(P)-binding protein [Xylaria scruposa]|nr:NAD(P)-binding protein [Xylaria scruposa]
MGAYIAFDLWFAVTLNLAEKGANVIIVARDAGNLEKGIAFISKGARRPDAQCFHYIRADVSIVIAEATEWGYGSPPDIVWCCSGSAHPTLFIKLRATPRVAAKDIQSHPAHHLIFTGSFISFYSFAGFTPYSPSKAAVRALSDSLSREMNLYAAAHLDLLRIRVNTVFLATMPTRSLEGENAVKTDLTMSLEEDDQILQPDECARQAIAGLDSGDELVPTSTIIRLVMAYVMGGSVRGGFWKGLVSTMLGWITSVVMIFIRWDMDAKVGRWGKKHGSSGSLKHQ